MNANPCGTLKNNLWKDTSDAVAASFELKNVSGGDPTIVQLCVLLRPFRTVPGKQCGFQSSRKVKKEAPKKVTGDTKTMLWIKIQHFK
jgi:hypothetical protein